ncbi:MAG: iron-containing alcohol dehydrogenase [Halieaceae bacterium]|jgi:alcohol dehydrogenase class IV|nr:iron-containing alcohol dehydrogenase [Halieaceae bacterium]
MTPSTVRLTATENVYVGERAAGAISTEAERLGAERVFLLVSRSLNSATDEIEQIRRELGPRLAACWDGMPPHAPRSAVLAAAAAARDANADLIVTVGGGSVTDAGKIVALCLKHDLREHDDLEPYHVYVDDHGEVVKPQFEGPDVRVINCPTTLSGGEFNPLSGATDEKLQHKQGYEHRLMAPVAIVLDPALTVHTPDWLWFSTGVRALDHALEALGSHQSNYFCDGMADSALRLLIEGLPAVKADPSDLDARLKCQVGAWQSMIPIIAGVPMGLSHAIGHVLGGTFDVPHGYCSCVMAPSVLAFNEPANGERQRRIRACFGADDRAASDLVAEFIAGLGMPRSLAEVGVAREQFPKLAETTMHDFWARTNPRPIAKGEDVMPVLELAAGEAP